MILVFDVQCVARDGLFAGNMTFNDGDNDRIGKEEEHAGLIENQIISQKTKVSILTIH